MSNKHILYNADLQVFICIHCQKGLPDNIPRHFSRNHGGIPLKERKEIKETIKDLRRRSVEEVPIPIQEVDAIEGIEVMDGFKYIADDACQESYGTIDSMTGHCRDKHDWTVQKPIQWIPQKIQTIFAEPNIKYFPVRMPSSNSSSSSHAFFDDMLAAAKRKDDERRLQRHKIVNDESSKDTPWLNRTGWKRMFDGKEMSNLVPGVNEQLSPDEEFFKCLRKIIHDMIEQDYLGVLDCDKRGWHMIRFWLNSTQKGIADRKPFRDHMKNDTREDYAKIWLRLILFCLRAVNQGQMYGVRFNDMTRNTLQYLIDLLKKEVQDIEAITQTVRQISCQLIMHNDYDKPVSALKYFSGILGYNVKTARWKIPTEFTPLVAQRDQFESTSSDNPHVRLNAFRDVWLVETEPTLFNYLHKLLNYGMSASKDDLGEYKIRIVDGTLYWGGDALKLDDLKTLQRDVLRRAESILSRELLFRNTDKVDEINPYSFGRDDHTIPDADYCFMEKIPDFRNVGRKYVEQNLQRSGRERDLVDSEMNEWKVAGIEEYRRSRELFLELVLVGVNCQSGGSGRGEEVLSTKYKNCTDGDRNVFLDESQILMILGYHKSQAIMDAVKMCGRFAPQGLSNLLLNYFMYVLPFSEMIDSEFPTHGYLWGDKDGHWGTARQTKVFTREFKRFGFNMTTNKWRHIQVALDSEIIQSGMETIEADISEDQISDLQRAHRTSTAKRIYGRGFGRLDYRTHRMFRYISDKWQQWYGLRSRKPESEFVKDVTMTDCPTVDVIQSALVALHGPEAEWRCKEQKESMEAIVRGDRYVVSILPTGGGKTDLIILSALMDRHKTCVVIDPYVALARDLEERCRNVGIDCVKWENGPCPRANIVVVVSDSSVSKEFKRFLRNLELDEPIAW